MNPLISIVVPIYNTEAYLAETIESVIHQLYTNWELLLIDDGSTDSSAKICQKYTQKDLRIQYHFKANSGQAAARNLGINLSKGEFVGFLDSDDLWTPEKLSQQLEEIQKFSPDFMYGLGYFYHPEKNQPLEKYDWITGEIIGKDFFQLLYHSCAVNTNTVLVKKSLFEKVGLFNEDQEMRGTEDWDLWLRIAQSVEKIYGSPSRNVYYRIHPGGIHLQHVRMFKGKAKIYAQYDSDPTIPRLRKLRQYRYVYRELMNFLWIKNRTDELKLAFNEFKKKDRFGVGTLKQRLLIRLLPMKGFMWISQKILYRISYRLEQITYWLFLK